MQHVEGPQFLHIVSSLPYLHWS